MVKYKYLKDLDLDLWRAVVKLYQSDPITHCYLMYDLVYDIDRIEVIFAFHNDKIVGYILVWRGPGVYGVHLWNVDIDMLKMVKLLLDMPTYIHLYTDNHSFADEVKRFLMERYGIGYIETLEFYDMIVDEENFKPYKPEIARKLGVRDIEAFMKIKGIQGRSITYEIAREILENGRYYGVFVDGELIAIAGRYIALPEVWVVGDVFVDPRYRGKGYGKIVTSAITRDAIVSGAVALLHVETRNVPAIKLYQGLGYRILRKRIWFYIAIAA